MLRAEDLDAFAGPVLVIVGADDEFAPLPELTAMLGSRPKCTLQVLTNVDHFFHFGGLHELDQRVCAHVSAWLKRA
jgi:pimeloyl-ACP methyl ester carboxylesterase